MKKFTTLAAYLVEGLKTKTNLNAFSRMLAKLAIETVLNTELTDRRPQAKRTKKRSNTRNGYSLKTLLCDDGEIELSTPCVRENTSAYSSFNESFQYLP